jgi:serine/threonine/tyrosine protein kinase RAD53
MLRDGNKIA